MHKLIHIYNQNRKKIWMGVIVLVFGFAIIQILNQFSIEKNKKIREQNLNQIDSNSNSIEKNYENESKSIVSDKTVSSNYRKDFGKVIDQFFTNCVNGRFQDAYDLLSSDCKEVLYPSQAIFEEQYCKNKFDGDKTYSFQSWSSSKAYIYLVKIFENMLSTGISSTENYIEDYVTIVKENDQYKLNINNFVGKQKIEKKKETTKAKIEVENSKIYMEKEVYTVKITNKTENTISIASKQEEDSIYIVDENQIKFKCLLNEILDSNLLIEKGKARTIQLTFNNSYRDNIKIKKIVFTHLITNYKPNQQNNSFIEKIEIDF